MPMRPIAPPVPPHVVVRNTPPLRCYYCAIGVNRPDSKPFEAPAFITCHDRRGCYHVCFEHAQWRMTTSWMAGHSPDCAFHRTDSDAPKESR
jgi:hypothetical protein